MTTFPSLQPSSRVFSAGTYPHTPFVAMSGKQNRVRHSSVMLGSRLQLTFEALSQSDMLKIKTHYDGQQGTFLAFDIPSTLTTGMTASDFSLTGYAWRYVEPPTVEDYCPQRHTVSVVLESLPPEGVLAAGLNNAAQLTFSGGATSTASTSAGANLTINASLTAGAANSTALPSSADLTVTTAFTAGAATAITTDPSFSSVQLLLHMNGTNGSTTFTDSSTNNFSMTAGGSPSISTAQSKFGGASAYFNGSSSLQTPSDSKLAIGAGDFTIEMWVYLTTLTGLHTFWAWEDTRTLFKESGNTIQYYVSPGVVLSSTTTMSANTWYHLAVTRASGVFRLFINGNQEGGTITNSTSMASQQPYIGRRLNTTTPYYMTGYIDDLRYTKGVARYTSSFTIPGAQFPDS